MIGCKIAMKPGGELISTSTSIVQQDGKSLWLIYRDSAGTNYSIYDSHKLKYSSYKFIKKKKLIIEYYDINGNLLDSTSENGYAKSVTIVKNGHTIDEYFLDNHGEMTQPKLFNFARIKRKYYRDGSWRVRYYDWNNKPKCDNLPFEYHYKWDTLWQISNTDTSFMLQYEVLDKKDCNGNSIK